jgi:hypothetical protein
MSTANKNSPIFDSNTNENILVSNEKSYDELIGYCALRKQFSRIIPSYYTEIQKQPFNNKRQNVSSIEEYKKLKEEINIMKESIELLKESKQKKLKQIEDLRVLMRKVGNKQLSYKDKKHINNNIINNYCTREKQSTCDQGFRCIDSKDSSCFKVSSDEGLSLAPTTSGLSSGKDDEAGLEDGANQPGPYGVWNSSNSSSGCWCFTDDKMPNNDLMLHIREEKTLLTSN